MHLVPADHCCLVPRLCLALGLTPGAMRAAIRDKPGE